MSEVWKNIVKSDNGMALLIAVTIVSLLVAVTVEFNRDMRQELAGAANLKEGSRLNGIVKSGFTLAKATLIQDGIDNKYDSLHDRWAKLADSSLAGLFGRSELKVRVEDLSGKLQLNALAKKQTGTGEPGTPGGAATNHTREVFLQLLLSGSFGEFSDEEAGQLVDAITDWVDEDGDESGVTETESSFYQSLNPPYTAKNRPIEHVEELLLIKGITRELFFGGEGGTALRDYVTAQGDDGKININTAPAEVLLAMNKGMTQELVDKLVAFREDEDNQAGLENSSWYSGVDGWDSSITLEQSIVGTVSSYFAIEVEAQFADREKKLSAVVHRKSKDEMEMITRRVE